MSLHGKRPLLAHPSAFRDHGWGGPVMSTSVGVSFSLVWMAVGTGPGSATVGEQSPFSLCDRPTSLLEHNGTVMSHTLFAMATSHDLARTRY